ncbi:MAG: Na(+)/H(+) antiporter subunit D [Gammaproteobacteria bacterium]|nr:Na(+)/H(+) antiporter subunit D [Gammaproteobacteria bacterium]
MSVFNLPPFVPFLIIAVLVLFSRGRLTTVLMLAAPLWGALNIWQVSLQPFEQIGWQVNLLALDLVPYRVDKLSLLFGYLFHIAALFAIIYALHVRDKVQQLSSLIYTAAALGAVFVGDLLSLFIFWELMALSSVFLIWARRSERSLTSGFRYLIYQCLSGLLLLIGTAFYWHQHGSVAFTEIELQGVGATLIFIAFGIKCGFPLLHTWLTDAYPEATPTGTIFLSALTTKVAVYAMARSFAGTESLVYIGAVMTCFPIFYAVIENDLRRVLAYSLINQLGFMVVGIGIGTELAINGAISHAFNDVLFKGLLFMSMGAVLQMTGKINGSDLGALYKTMPKTTLLCLIGAASISAFPLFNGFISKSMVMSAALAQGYDVVWLMLLFASAGVFHHAGIKIPYFAFFGHDSGLRASDPPANMLIGMSIAAALCIIIGVYPNLLYQILPYSSDYNPYDTSHILAQTQLLCFSALAFVWLKLKGIYPAELHSTNLDSDWLYRRLLPNIWVGLISQVSTVDQLIRQHGGNLYRQLLLKVEQYQQYPILILANQTVGQMTLWIIIVLACFLALSLLGS